jgi:hypothetical protein
VLFQLRQAMQGSDGNKVNALNDKYMKMSHIYNDFDYENRLNWVLPLVGFLSPVNELPQDVYEEPHEIAR